MADTLTDAAAQLETVAAQLAAALALWERRDTGDDVTARWSANNAVEHIDVMVAGLHDVRRRLVAGMRAYDDAVLAGVPPQRGMR